MSIMKYVTLPDHIYQTLWAATEIHLDDIKSGVEDGTYEAEEHEAFIAEMTTALAYQPTEDEVQDETIDTDYEPDPNDLEDRAITEGRAAMIPARFHLDGAEYEGWHNPNVKMDGHECPYFSFDTAIEILNDLKCDFDVDHENRRIKFEEDTDWMTPIDGLYPVGSFYWNWLMVQPVKSAATLLAEWVEWYDKWNNADNPCDVYDPPVEESRQLLNTKIS